MDEPTVNEPRNRLIQAAADLFHDRSYGTVGIQDVCDRAEVRRGSFYYYFRSKDELAIEALERSTDLLVAAVHEPAFSNTDPPVKQLSRFVDLLHRYCLDLSDRFGVQIGCPVANLAEELSTISATTRQKASEKFERIHSYYEAFIRRAMEQGDAARGDAANVARRFLALVQGALLQAKVTGDATVLTDLYDSLALIAGLHTDP